MKSIKKTLQASLQDTLPLDVRLFYIAYQILFPFILPLAIFILYLKSRREPLYRLRFLERLSIGSLSPKETIWIYAASLGETRAVAPLVKIFLSHGYNILLTHQTPSGLLEGERLFSGNPNVSSHYIPFDYFLFIRIFLTRHRPIALVIAEIEVWPSMLIESFKAGVPIFMVNGNLLERALARKNTFAGKLLSLYQLFTQIYTRTDVYVNRYTQIGVKPRVIRAVGDLKSDLLINSCQISLGKNIRDRWQDAHRVLVISSSVQSEEPHLIPVIKRLLDNDSHFRVVWVPRSPQRFDRLEESLKIAGIHTAKRSQLDLISDQELGKCQVIVGNTTGEINLYYAMADLAFVGGSINSDGGHNVIEPMAVGLPVLIGPSIYGVEFAALPAAEAGALIVVPDIESLESQISILMNDSCALSKMSQAALSQSRLYSGVALRIFDTLKYYLPASRSQ